MQDRVGDRVSRQDAAIPGQLRVRDKATTSEALPVWAVGFAGFVLVTAVTYPVGVLPQIATDLNTSAGSAGLMLTVSGLTLALVAWVTGVYGRNADRRLILVGAMAGVGAGNLVSAAAPNYGVLLLGRLAVGAGGGMFWSIAAGVAPLLVPAARVPRATAVIFGSAAAASALGVPLITAIGTGAGWRSGVAVLAVLAATACTVLIFLLPRLTPTDQARWAAGPPLIHTLRDIAGVLVVASLAVAGQFAAFTFARPVLEDISGFSRDAVPALLSAFGFAGIAGTMLAGRLAPASPRRAAQLIATAMAAAVLALPLFQGSSVVAAFALCLWGAGYGALGVTLPLWVHDRAPSDHVRAAAIYIAVFNAAIAAGAALGGVAVDLTDTRPSMIAPLILGCSLMACAVAATQTAARRSARNQPEPQSPSSRNPRLVVERCTRRRSRRSPRR
jgi:predicted MFS family arabinose efflux permease